MLSILSGLSPFVHGSNRMESPTPSNLRLVGDYLRDAGYRSAAFGENGFLTGRGTNGVLPLTFDRFEIGPREPRPLTLSFRFFSDYLPSGYRQMETTEGITSAVEQWLDGRGDDDFFLWTHYYDPHAPYEPPTRLLQDHEGRASIGEDLLSALRVGSTAATPEIERDLRTLYEAEVRLVDENVGRLIEALEREGAYEEALIVVTSDHGEELLDHGGVDHLDRAGVLAVEVK